MHRTNPNQGLTSDISDRPSLFEVRFLIWSVIIFCLIICTQSFGDAVDEPAAFAKLSRKIVPSTSVAKFLSLNFLQNLVVDSNGDVIVNSVSDGRIWRISRNGSTEVLGQVPGQAFSVAEAPDNGFIVITLKLDGVVAMFHISESGEVERVLDVVGAIFPNGLESLAEGRYIFADSVRGIIWEVNYWKRTFEVFLEHELLKPEVGKWGPSANGLRIFDGKLFISNTNRKLFLSVELCDNKPIVNTFKIVKEKIFVDDFDFDEAGNVYITTHPMNVVLRLTPKGAISIIAGPEQGVIGNTACRFGRRVGDEKSLYVVSDGGMFTPDATGLHPSAVFRLEIDMKGAPGGEKIIPSCAEKKQLHEEH